VRGGSCRGTADLNTGWLRSVGSIKSYVAFAEYRLFYKAVSQKTYESIDPTNRSHSIRRCAVSRCIIGLFYRALLQKRPIL